MIPLPILGTLGVSAIAVIAILVTWLNIERSGRLEATRQLEAAQVNLANRSKADEARDEVDRAPDGDALERLRRDWSR